MPNVLSQAGIVGAPDPANTFIDLNLGVRDGDRFSLMRGCFPNRVAAAFDFHHFAVQASKCSHPHSIMRLRRGYGMVSVRRLIVAAYRLAWAGQPRVKYISRDCRALAAVGFTGPL